MVERDERTEIQNKVNDYEQTVKALIAFSAFVVHDSIQFRPEAKFGFGRRMKTSASNEVSPNATITPDFVGQKSRQYGVVAEVKKSLSSDQSTWYRHVEQLRTYDDRLIGWWTDNEQIDHSDVVLLIHYLRSRAFVQYIQSLSKEETVGENTAIVEFTDSQETGTNYVFRVEFGRLVDEELQKRLHNGIAIPLDKVLNSFPTLKFYDSEPPVEYILTDLWTELLPSMISEESYEEGSNGILIRVSVQETTRELQSSYGSANPLIVSDEKSVEFPKQHWVKRAFEALENYKLAKRDSGKDDAFLIEYRSFRGDVLEKFIDLGLAFRAKKGKGSQSKESLLPGILNGEKDNL